MPSAEFPTRWPLPVCRFCGRPAHWPFCEHRAVGGDWFVNITVRGNVPERERRVFPSAGECNCDGDDETGHDVLCPRLTR